MVIEKQQATIAFCRLEVEEGRECRRKKDSTPEGG